jgi:hypothetical protein
VRCARHRSRRRHGRPDRTRSRARIMHSAVRVKFALRQFVLSAADPESAFPRAPKTASAPRAICSRSRRGACPRPRAAAR